jgi:uncharacterized protein YbjT (DUF2867 family)
MILVTGATGNLGAELVRALAGGGEQVRTLVRRDAERAKLPAGVDALGEFAVLAESWVESRELLRRQASFGRLRPGALTA